jgi:signal transduction histidine kinase
VERDRDTLEFSIAPAYYQTTWFHTSCVAALLFMLWGLHRPRLYQIRREFNAQLDGRIDERLRVARELHDTLLQSFQASLIRMQAARNVFARRPEKAVQSLDDAITMAAGTVAEGGAPRSRTCAPSRPAEAISCNCSPRPVRS